MTTSKKAKKKPTSATRAAARERAVSKKKPAGAPSDSSEFAIADAKLLRELIGKIDVVLSRVRRKKVWPGDIVNPDYRSLRENYIKNIRDIRVSSVRMESFIRGAVRKSR